MVTQVLPTRDGALAGDQVAGTQAISRALAVLRVFREQASDLGIMQLSSILGLTPSTTHRIVRALVAAGYLTQSGVTDRYLLGREAVLLGMAAQRNLGLDAARTVLEAVGAATGESVNLGVRDHDQDCALVVLRIASPQPLRFDQPPGTRVPLHASSMGKALLAHGGDEPFPPAGVTLTRYTPTTITTPRRLRLELAEVRARGFSVDREESTVGVTCVGAPVLDEDGRAFAAVAIQAPTVRMSPGRMDELGELIRSAADDVASVLSVSGLRDAQPRSVARR